MKTIEYSERGIAYSDHCAEDIARDFLREEDEYLCTSTENIIYAVRVLIREEMIPHDQVRFLFHEEYLPPNRDGSLNHWPYGFSDKFDGWLMRLF